MSTQTTRSADGTRIAFQTYDEGASLVSVGRTLLYDALCLGSSEAPVPAELLGSIEVPVLCLGSTGSPDWLRAGAEASATATPDGRFVVLEGGYHGAPAALLAPMLVEHHRL